MVKANYVPMSDELRDAISTSVDIESKPKAKGVVKVISENNPTWKITERRVAKILRKLNNPDETTGGDEDDADDKSAVSMSSSAARKLVSIGKSFRNIGGKKRSSRKLESPITTSPPPLLPSALPTIPPTPESVKSADSAEDTAATVTSPTSIDDENSQDSTPPPVSVENIDEKEVEAIAEDDALAPKEIPASKEIPSNEDAYKEEINPKKEDECMCTIS